MKLYKRLLNYLKPYWLHIAGALIGMLIISGANVLLIPLVGKLTDAIATKNFFLLNLVVLFAFGLYFIKGLFSYAQAYLIAFAGQRMVRDLRVALYKHLQDLSLDFFTKWRTGEVMSRLLGDIGNIQNALINSITDILPNVITFMGVLIYLLYLNWRLTIVTVLTIPILAYMISRFSEEMRSIARRTQRKMADISSLLQERLTGVKVVKSFAMEKHEISKFEEEADESFWLSMRESQISATISPLTDLIQLIALAVVVWYGGYEVVSGHLTGSSLVSFFTGIALLINPIAVISRINIQLQKAFSSAERVFEVIDIVPTVKEAPNPIKLSKIDGAVEFKNVSFYYEKQDGLALKNINIRVNPGEIIALVGPSGAGKSTFVSLIPRFYDPTSGEIIIDGKNIKLAEIYSLRKQMGIVPQETLLFSGTLKENIAYGKIDATEDEIIESAKAANAHDFIVKLPKSYNTFVGERGIRLSGGERQRIAIARAILKDPRILILDEATSSLDSESERLVQDAMERLMAGRTTFIIAHRLSTVHIANRIIVLNEGEIVEHGTHKELIKNDGLYKKLYEMQFRDK